MGEIIDKVKEKAQDVKDTVVDITKLPLKISILSQKFVLELNGALAMENAGIERLQIRISETIVPEAKQRMEIHMKVWSIKKDCKILLPLWVEPPLKKN